MTIYLKWYYWYKNLGDELLLFGVINRLVSEYNTSKIYIESADITRLNHRLTTNSRAVPDSVTVLPVSKKANLRTKRDLTVFWWWEVVSDARPFPYNGWTYLALFLPTLITKKYIIIWWVGIPKRVSTKRLYAIFLKRAQKMVVRDKHSFQVSKQYSEYCTLYKDFCYDFLAQYMSRYTKKPRQSNHLIININKYIRSQKTQDTIYDRAEQHKTVYYIPWELWSDDVFYKQLKETIPHLQLLDRTVISLEELLWIVSTAEYGIAARLHVLLLLDYFWVKYTPLVYQEKINHVLWVPKK